MLQRQMKFLQVPGISSERFGLEMLVVSYFYQIVDRVAASRSKDTLLEKRHSFSYRHAHISFF